MEESYRQRVRDAIVDIAGHVAKVQERVTIAVDEHERAKAQGNPPEMRAELATRRSDVLDAKAALQQGVKKMKELAAAQIPANSDDAGLFDALAIASETVENADRFLENTRDDG